MSLRGALQFAAAVYDRVSPPDEGLVVLIYHRVGGGTSSAVDLPVEAFDAQIRLLVSARAVLRLDDAVTQLTAGKTPKGVVLTFDDGTPDFYEVALPVLQHHGVPATLYAATGPIDRGESMPWGVPSATWDGLRVAAETGLVTIESHTRDHALLDRLDRAAVAEQLNASITSITEQIGVAPRHFAYPKAVHGNAAAEIEVRTRFASAALAGNRVNVAGGDVHHMGRTPIQRTDSLATFERKIHGGLRLEGSARAAVTRRRVR